MALLDFTLDHDDLASIGKLTNNPLQALDRLVSRKSSKLSPGQRLHDMTDGVRPIYSLLDGRDLHATSGLPTVSVQDANSTDTHNNASVQSVTTPDYAEFVLQLLDKNSLLSSIMILVAYIMIFRAL